MEYVCIQNLDEMAQLRLVAPVAGPGQCPACGQSHADPVSLDRDEKQDRPRKLQTQDTRSIDLLVPA